jgi:hypothetical protein
MMHNIAARAADPVSYAAVDQDVMSRWSYPLFLIATLLVLITTVMHITVTVCTLPHSNVTLEREALAGHNIKFLANIVTGPGTKVVLESRRNVDDMTIQPFQAFQIAFEYKLSSGTSREGVGSVMVVESREDSISSENDYDFCDTPALYEETMITDELAVTIQRAPLMKTYQWRILLLKLTP